MRGLRSDSAHIPAMVVRIFTRQLYPMTSVMRITTLDQARRPKSKEQDKDAGDHQREHPDEINVEPRPAQYRDPEFFVNHNRDQRGR